METLLVVGLLLVLLAAMSPSLYALQKRLATMPQDLDERTGLEKFCPNARYLERLECS